jgi:hypothetical protein
MSDVTDDRHDRLVAALERRGWLGGIYHQQHQQHQPAVAVAHVALAFGNPDPDKPGALMRVWAAADRPAHSHMWRELQPHPTLIGEQIIVRRHQERPFVKGEGYGAELVLVQPGGDRRETKSFATAEMAADQLAAWRTSLTPEQRAAFDEATGIVFKRPARGAH